MDEQKTNLDYDLADIITQKPHEFKVGRKLFRLYPVTLAKQFLLRGLIDGLNINGGILRTNAIVEALRLAETRKEACCQILAIHTTPNTFKDLHDTNAITVRRNVLEKMSTEDIASMLLFVLTSDKTEQMIRRLGLDKELERLNEVLEIKRESGRNNMTFGGLTVFGSFIGQLKEMGYSDNEIIYEKGYTFLRLMLADKVTSVYLTDDELNSISTSAGGKMLDGNDPASFDKLKSRLGFDFNE